jgi:hypothetical protein
MRSAWANGLSFGLPPGLPEKPFANGIVLNIQGIVTKQKFFPNSIILEAVFPRRFSIIIQPYERQ